VTCNSSIRSETQDQVDERILEAISHLVATTLRRSLPWSATRLARQSALAIAVGLSIVGLLCSGGKFRVHIERVDPEYPVGWKFKKPKLSFRKAMTEESYEAQAYKRKPRLVDPVAIRGTNTPTTKSSLPDLWRPDQE
jgi:hypothetical protein